MTYLILGLVLFLGTHSLRIVADGWRTAQVARLGEKRWKGLLSIASIAAFVLVVWGFGQARMADDVLWIPPPWTRHAAALLTLVAFVLVTAAYVPGTRIKAALGHPMVGGVATWAFAHLIANGTLANVVLFGSFLAWATVDFVSARRRDRVAERTYPPGPVARDVLAVVVGIAAWAAFALWLHGPLIGLRPFG